MLWRFGWWRRLGFLLKLVQQRGVARGHTHQSRQRLLEACKIVEERWLKFAGPLHINSKWDERELRAKPYKRDRGQNWDFF
ncbi:hypothetical protein DsansV1_C09g0094051 [Dioscorea sansibarensis]